MEKKEAVTEALGTSISSIIVSGLCFFGATFGVGVYSKIEMIGSLCNLMARGAIISMITVICVLPAFLMIFPLGTFPNGVSVTFGKNHKNMFH